MPEFYDCDGLTEDQAMFLAESAWHDECYGLTADDVGEGDDECDVPEFD